jgi:hypothetical protein
MSCNSMSHYYTYLLLLHVSSYILLCVLMLLYMCPHTTIHVYKFETGCHTADILLTYPDVSLRILTYPDVS